MLISYKENNNLYLVFQDFLYKESDIYEKLNIFPKKCAENINKILKDNFFSNSLNRHKNYINTISTYIDDISEDNQQYFFYLFILPKDLEINYDNISDREIISKVEKLSIKIFKLYSSLNIFTDKRLELLKTFKGENFVQLEILFYIKQLELLYSNLINFNSSFKNKIICSDKKIGIEIEFLNRIESNPLKNYQFVKSKYQKDLLVFVYSTIHFLINNKLDIFKIKQPSEYKKLLQVFDKIKNYLQKIGNRNDIVLEHIDKNTIFNYLAKYKTKEEILKNIKIYKIIESLFFTQLENDTQFFISLDLTKIFEKIVEKKLQKYSDSLYIGDENKSRIYHYKNQSKFCELNSINNLLNNGRNQLKQYPDFLIEDIYNEERIFHVLDAKYKLEENIFNENDTRQILVYSVLFNKIFLDDIKNQKYIKKIIIYARKNKINLDDTYDIKFNFSQIELNAPNFEIKENVFNSSIEYFGINILD